MNNNAHVCTDIKDTPSKPLSQKCCSPNAFAHQ